MKRKIVVVTISTLLCCIFVKPVVAQVQILALPVIANPVGLVLIGTVVIGGVIWYKYENRHTHKRYRSQVPPYVMKIEPGRHNVGDYVYVEVARFSDCQREAERYGREVDGGIWEVESVEQVGSAGEPGTINPDGSIHEPTISYRCKLKKVR